MKWMQLVAMAVCLCVTTGHAQQEITVDLPGGAQMEMIWVEPGTFLMGAASPDEGDGDEYPQHQVAISRGGYIGKFEITQKQWLSVMETCNWCGRDFVEEGDNFPALYLSWDDVQEFVKKLNTAAGQAVWRLPTEAEWEYACRAGTTTRWSFGDDESLISQYAWHRDITWPLEVYAHEVGSKLPNPWGLYDVHGNAWEWVEDWYRGYTVESKVDPVAREEGVFRVARGGIYLSLPGGQRCAARDAGFADYQDGGVGARLWYNAVPTAIAPQGWGAVKERMR